MSRLLKEKKIKILWSLAIVISLLLLWGGGTGYTAITGPCVNCHTMHNSQGGTAMATYGGETGPNSCLVRGSCIGCHAQGGTSKIVTIGGSQIPQVYHTGGTDLAGGNFKHIDTYGADRGHNVIDLFGTDSDDDLDGPPGYSYHYGVTDSNMTCAGTNGCHGARIIGSVLGSDVINGLPALKGAHHGNVDGRLNSAYSVSNSYRFLLGVKGLENPTENPTERWQNVDLNSHNEYYGYTVPSASLACSNCHRSSGIMMTGKSISGFCGTCHGNFYLLDGIGGDAFSPFHRHPSDILIKNEGEYAVSKRTYEAQAPVGRTWVPASAITTATTDDVVTCLSCHAPHATENPDILRWNYSAMVAGGEDNETGCFACHTTKDKDTGK